MSDIAPDIFPFLVAALEDERRELDQCILFLIGKLPAQLPRSTPPLGRRTPSVFIALLLHRSEFTIIIIHAIRPSSARMMDLEILQCLHRFLLLLLLLPLLLLLLLPIELIPRAIGRRISAFERHCERLISNHTCLMNIIGLYRDELIDRYRDELKYLYRDEMK